jgi:hypothetical protein
MARGGRREKKRQETEMKQQLRPLARAIAPRANSVDSVRAGYKSLTSARQRQLEKDLCCPYDIVIPS